MEHPVRLFFEQANEPIKFIRFEKKYKMFYCYYERGNLMAWIHAGIEEIKKFRDSKG